MLQEVQAEEKLLRQLLHYMNGWRLGMRGTTRRIHTGCFDAAGLTQGFRQVAPEVADGIGIQLRPSAQGLCIFQTCPCKLL